MKFTQPFNPAEIEKFWRQKWEQQEHFLIPITSEKPIFSTHLPPPNITGTLHMGHALNQTIIDSLTRYHRMQGFNTAWIPGIDHAGIATQIIVERQLNEKKISRNELGRAKFIKKVLEWKKESSSVIIDQMRRLGISPDWSRQYFTMDKKISKAVTEAFVRLHQQGLIYRGKKLVNWDPILHTALSDLEVTSKEEENWIWYIRYPLIHENTYITIATTRPETMLGDVAIAVNSTDERYIHLVGKKVKLPFSNREIPIIANDNINKTFGTGCVKITPAHDFNDYAISLQHNLNKINIFTLDAKINTNGPIQYQGMDRFEARKQIISDLHLQGLLEKAQPHKSMIPRNERTNTIIEPMLTNQWFIAMSKPTSNNIYDIYHPGKSITQVALEKVANGEIKFIPSNWNKIYNQWLNNIQDWCISRQLWWGHQIPAWYDNLGKVYVAHNEDEAKAQAGGKNACITRDSDVLDTWFSAAMIPFATLGWPKKTRDYRLLLPASTLVTGCDIIFFWVARMIMMTTHFTGCVPFKTVYLHGLVRDAHGQKMSKSRGNTIDPIDVIDGINLQDLIIKRSKNLINSKQVTQIKKTTSLEFKNGIPAFGADALRLTFTSLATPGNSINYNFNRCISYRNFCNKLWNATRFVIENTKNCNEIYDLETKNMQYSNANDWTNANNWILSSLHRTIQTVKNSFSNYRFDNVTSAIYKFVWDEYCDWYLEIAKIHLKLGNHEQKQHTRKILLHVLECILRLAHPIIPFITEDLWQVVIPLLNTKINIANSSITQQLYPISEYYKINKKAEDWIEYLKQLTNFCRHLRNEMQLSSTIQVPLIIETTNDTYIRSFLPYLQILAKLATIQIVKKLPLSIAPVAIFQDMKLMLAVATNVTFENKRIKKNIDYVNSQITKLKLKLNNQEFIKNAKATIVTRDQNHLQELNSTLIKLQEQLLKLKTQPYTNDENDEH